MRGRSDDEMFGLIHQMRQRIIETPCFGEGKVIGAILFEKTMDGDSGGKPVPARLAERGVVPFLKVDKGLEDEADGVQLMKPMPELEALCTRAKAKGVFGTKMRSVIKSNNAAGIAAIVEQQFAEGARISATGLMPMLEPEYDIHAADRAEGEKVLRDAILAKLDAAARRPAGHAQALDPGRGGVVRAPDRAPQGAAGRRAVGRLFNRRGVRKTQGERGDDRQLQPRPAAGPAGISRATTNSTATLGGAIDQIHAASVT